MSIIGDGLMGALDIGRGYLQADIKADNDRQKADETAARQEASDIRKDELAQKRMIATEQLKEEFARSQSESKYKRLQNEGTAIEEEAKNIDFKRSGGLINSIRNSVPNEGDFANQELSPEDIATIRTKMSPADAEKFYGIKPQTALSVTDDLIAAAKNVGAYESRPALVEQRKQLADTDKQDRLEKKNDELAKIKADDVARKADRDIDKFTTDKMREETRATNAEKAAKGEKVMTYIDGQRKEIASESAEINKQLTAELKDKPAKEQAAIKAEYKPRLDALAEKRNQLDQDFKEIRGTFNLSPIGGKNKEASPSESIYRASKDSGIDPSYLVGLAKLETQLGSKSIKGNGEDSRNLFNVKDFSGKGIRAKDKAEGSNDAYRTYSNYDESIADVISLIERRYPDALKAKTPEEFATALKEGGYATDPDYVKKLTSAIISSKPSSSIIGGSFKDAGTQVASSRASQFKVIR